MNDKDVYDVLKAKIKLEKRVKLKTDFDEERREETFIRIYVVALGHENDLRASEILSRECVMESVDPASTIRKAAVSVADRISKNIKENPEDF